MTDAPVLDAESEGEDEDEGEHPTASEAVAIVTVPDRTVPATLAWAVALVPPIALAWGGWAHRWTNEDAFINYRVVEHVMAGNGPVFNAGERVEAYTSALWLGVLVVADATLGQILSLPWTGVVVGLAAAVAGFAIGGATARRLHAGAIPVPLGLLMAAAIPVMWDFATSGLELGAVWLWLAGCWAVLVRLAGADQSWRGRRRAGALVLLGIGPLLRPDLGLMAVVLLGTWALLARPSRRRLLADAATAVAVPFAYQVFRMGYFGSLVPSTALAKDAGGLHLRQGATYAGDLVTTYELWIPLLAVGAVLAHAIARRPRPLAVATGGMVVASAAHAGYMVAVGGDYMHGRLLLPALVAVALPASFGLPAVPALPQRPAERAKLGAVAVVAVWGIACVASMRYVNPTSFGPAMVSDWRQVAPRPLVEPVEGEVPWLTGAQVADLYADGERGTIQLLGYGVDPTGDPDELVWMLGSIGLSGYNAGTEVHVVDLGGLAEPLAARTDPVPGRPAGHRKQLHPAWATARFGIVHDESDDVSVAAAESALECPGLRDLMAAVSEPMTPGRFATNLIDSVSLTRLHVPSDPVEAERELC